MNKVGIVVPVVYAGTIFLTTILSAFVFKEKITGLQSIGLAFLAIGFAFIIYVKATGN
jgi:drug/metabolite transporter (DMT)-like permease